MSASSPRGVTVRGCAFFKKNIDIAGSLGLPLVVEEFGWKPRSTVDMDAERATVYEGWLSVAHFEGVGTMPWMIGEDGRENYDGLLITPDWEQTWEIISCAGVTQ